MLVSGVQPDADAGDEGKLTVHAKESTIGRQNFTNTGVCLLFHQGKMVIGQ